MVEQVRRAVAWVYRNAGSFGGDPNALYTISRSSGSHLNSCVLITDWEKEGLPRDILKGSRHGEWYVRPQACAKIRRRLYPMIKSPYITLGTRRSARTGPSRRCRVRDCEETSSSPATEVPSSAPCICHAALPNVDAELEQLTINPRRSPQRIGNAHLADQLADLG